jgi:hypothetical protein
MGRFAAGDYVTIEFKGETSGESEGCGSSLRRYAPARLLAATTRLNQAW